MASDEARVVTEAAPPFRITHVNAAWEELCGYRRADVLGVCGFSFLQVRDLAPLLCPCDAVADSGDAPATRALVARRPCDRLLLVLYRHGHASAAHTLTPHTD